MLIVSIFNPGPNDIDNYMFSPGEAGVQQFYSVEAEARLDLPADAAERLLKDHPFLEKKDEFWDPPREEEEGTPPPEDVVTAPSDDVEKEDKPDEEADGGTRDIPVETIREASKQSAAIEGQDLERAEKNEVVKEKIAKAKEVKTEEADVLEMQVPAKPKGRPLPKGEFICDECGFKAKFALGLSSHKAAHERKRKQKEK